MDTSFGKILNPPTSYPPVSDQQASLEASNRPIDLGLTDSPSENARKRPASRIKSSYPRKRAIQACQKCRVRRTKCDNQRPTCGSCADLGVECSYSDADPSSFDAASLAILEKLGAIEQLLKTNDTDDKVFRRHTLSSTISEVPSSASPLPQINSLNSPSLERSKDVGPYHMSIEKLLGWPIFHELKPTLDLRQLLNASNDSQAQATLLAGETEIPPWDDRLVKNFMTDVYIFNPVIDEAKIQKYIRDARFAGIGQDGASCLLLLIFAIGSLSSSTDPQPLAFASDVRQQLHFRQAEAFYAAAQKRMGMLLSRSGVLEAQCFFLAGVYLMATMRPLEGWKMFVQALACCQAFYGTGSEGTVENERERRLNETIYWTCFKSELEVRLELNVTDASGWDLRYPSFFPSPPDELRSNSQTEVVWYYFLAEIALRRLANRILNYIYSIRPSETGPLSIDMAEQVGAFEQQASDWKRSLPGPLSLDKLGHTSPGESEIHQTLRFILEGELIDCYEIMYWPSIADAINRSGDLPPLANQDFARKALVLAVDRIDKNGPGFHYRHHGTWIMIRTCTRSGLLLLAASRASHVRHLLPHNWQNAVGKVVNMLRFWRHESEDIANRLNLIEAMLGTT